MRRLIEVEVEIEPLTVTFPDLPGCIICGETQEDALKNAKEALELYMYYLEEDNETIPQPSNILVF